MEERLYDLIFIARPATPEEDVKKVLGIIEHACTEKGAKVEKAETWGTRKLAYIVAKHREGMFYYQQIRTTNPLLARRRPQHRNPRLPQRHSRHRRNRRHRPRHRNQLQRADSRRTQRHKKF
jgi:ribosomal protein S6